MNRHLAAAKLLAAVLFSGSLLPAAYAAQNPKATRYDARMQYVAYNPDDVVNIRTKIGEASLIQLQEGETVSGGDSGLGMGDAGAWKMQVRGRNLYFKPAAPQPDTNLLITTNKNRTYAFRLKTAKKNEAPTYVLRFRYPGDERAARAAENAKQRRAAEILAAQLDKDGIGGAYNRDYWGRGDKALAPASAHDNGRFTYLRYPNARALPAVFRVNADGSEATVNSHVDGDTLIIHETARRFVLRLGKSVLGLENRSHDTDGTFNRTGTTQDNTVRLNKGTSE